MIPDYKGYKIDVTPDGKFRAIDSEGEEEASDYSLSNLKDRLDKISKKSIRTKVWILGYQKLESGTLTSVKQSHGYGGTPSFEARVSYDHGSWGQVNPNSVYPMNPENDTWAKQYLDLEAHMLELEKSKHEIIKKMKSINIQELLK